MSRAALLLTLAAAICLAPLAATRMMQGILPDRHKSRKSSIPAGTVAQAMGAEVGFPRFAISINPA